jgi:hypothetical protein
VSPAVSPVTLIGVVVPVADLATPPLLDVHEAVYFGVVNALPFVCAEVSSVNRTSSTPAAFRAATG